MARLLGVSVTGYFDWLHRKPSKRQREREKALKLVMAAHEATRESYSAVRLHQHLSNQGHSLSLHCVRGLREKNGIRCKRHQHYEARTEATKDIQHFIEIFYNRMRIQAKLNFRSPAQVFEGFKMAA
jgi:hypothetical protein